MRFRFWPNTLAVQLIVVTGVAVALSNIAVAFWFEYGNEQQNAIANNERVLDRAAAVATTLTAVPASSHYVVMNTMSSRIWKFAPVPVPKTARAMTPEEATLAKHLDEMLPDSVPNQNLISVKLHAPIADLPANLVPHTVGPVGDTIQAIVPVDKHTMMSGVFVRGPAPWPMGSSSRCAAPIDSSPGWWRRLRPVGSRWRTCPWQSPRSRPSSSA